MALIVACFQYIPWKCCCLLMVLKLDSSLAERRTVRTSSDPQKRNVVVSQANLIFLQSIEEPSQAGREIWGIQVPLARSATAFSEKPLDTYSHSQIIGHRYGLENWYLGSGKTQIIPWRMVWSKLVFALYRLWSAGSICTSWQPPSRSMWIPIYYSLYQQINSSNIHSIVLT